MTAWRSGSGAHLRLLWWNYFIITNIFIDELDNNVVDDDDEDYDDDENND